MEMEIASPAASSAALLMRNPEESLCMLVCMSLSTFQREIWMMAEEFELYESMPLLMKLADI